MIPCRVCEGGRAVPFQSVEGKDYWRCTACLATFLDAAFLPDLETERTRYLEHENDPADQGYRDFLSRLAVPLLARLPPGRTGLDYGCGTGPALADLLEEAGHMVRLYDPIFRPDPCVLRDTYDFVACTEVFEHMHHPAEELRRLDALLRPGGWLGVMTSFLTDDAAFADWYYRRDPTHVVFYREETFKYLAAGLGWVCDVPVANVALLRKPLAAG